MLPFVLFFEIHTSKFVHFIFMLVVYNKSIRFVKEHILLIMKRDKLVRDDKRGASWLAALQLQAQKKDIALS